MDIEIEDRKNGYYRIVLRGELRGAAGVDMEKRLHVLIAERSTSMAVDLSEVSMVDSSGLSELINLVTHARLSQSQVVLVAPSPFVEGVFKATRLDKWFDIAGDMTAAEQKLQVD